MFLIVTEDMVTFFVMMNISFINIYHAFSGIVGTDIYTPLPFLYIKKSIV